MTDDNYFDSEKHYRESIENPSRRSFFGKLGAIVAGAVVTEKMGRAEPVPPAAVEAAKVELVEDYPAPLGRYPGGYPGYTFAVVSTDLSCMDVPYTTSPGLVRDYRWEDSDALRQGGEVRLPEKYGRLKRR